MQWPPAGSDPGLILLYYFALWLLLVTGPVVAWIALYHVWLRHAWEPHFRDAEEAEARANRP
jgi:hypothetical protein